jgi:hypothetical protein
MFDRVFQVVGERFVTPFGRIQFPVMDQVTGEVSTFDLGPIENTDAIVPGFFCASIPLPRILSRTLPIHWLRVPILSVIKMLRSGLARFLMFFLARIRIPFASLFLILERTMKNRRASPAVSKISP